MSDNASVSTEVERKFLLPAEGTLPSFDRLGLVGAPRYMELNALYFDTVSLDLIAAGNSLRRRSGGSDAGWHLKLKVDGPHSRLEVVAPIEGARPPQSLRAALPRELRGRALVPVARLRTKRTEIPLIDKSGAEIAVICVDDVEATDEIGDASPAHFRELEVELGEGETDLLEVLGEAFLEDGLGLADYPSKVSHALDMLGLAKPAAGSGVPSAKVPVLTYMEEQVGVLQSLEQAALLDEPDAVHQARVAARRLRATLRTFKPIFSPTEADLLIAELKWYGEVLGDMRDEEVLKAHVEESMESSKVTLPSKVAESIDARLGSLRSAGQDHVAQSQASPRFEVLHDALGLMVWQPSVSELASLPAAALLPALAQKETGRAARAYSRALATPDDLEGWHTFRKRAKGVRYANEALEGWFSGADEAAALWKGVTSSFGDLQDTHMALEWLSSSGLAVDALIGYEKASLPSLLARAVSEAEKAFVSPYR